MNLYYSDVEKRFSTQEMPETKCFENVPDDLVERLIALLPCDAEKTVAEIDAIFTQIYDDAANAPQPPSFTELVVKHMKRLGCETDTQFAEMTLLDASFYWQIIRHDKRVWSRNTAWSIIAGFKLNRIQMCELLASLNIVLHPESSYEDRVYSFMFGKLEGRPIDEWNRFLKKRGLLLLGSTIPARIIDQGDHYIVRFTAKPQSEPPAYGVGRCSDSRHGG
ncbi:hypothetical protein AGMMS49992_33640 [Clostridia bacterium]|nr:hypothetical protein AGMMS49992_33640 [Clostridia bacterium]